MNTPLVIFWAVLIFASIAWYGFLVFYIGWKGAREIGQMTRSLKARHDEKRAEKGTE
ncbi:MAG TPA: hypothetical protein VI454_00535 [Verrucomicrobiae bacterium]|jgi:hypothetical protein